MPIRSLVAILFALFFINATGNAQIIHGEVYDADTKQVVSGVTIQNIYTSLDVTSGENGGFVIAAANGQLLEFKKQGYKMVGVRIPMGYIPSYFKIAIHKGFQAVKQDGNHDTRYNYTADSIRFHDIYSHELDFPKMSAMDMIAHPFSAMSSKNREIWQFQDDYNYFEKEKYVDRTFNAELIQRFTGLSGDSLRYFMRKYRPSYDQLKSMNDYNYFNFIRQSAHTYRNPNTPRGAQ